MNDYGQINDVEYWSQELRLNSPGDGKLTWFAGASVYQEKIDGIFDYIYDEDALCRALSITEAPDFDGPGRGLRRPELRGLLGGRHRSRRTSSRTRPSAASCDVESEGWAVYGDFTWALSDRLELTAGARYTYDKKEIDEPRCSTAAARSATTSTSSSSPNGTVSDSADWDEFTPRLALSLRRQRRRHALRDGIARLQVRRLRDLRLRPARPGHQRRRLRPGRHDAARVRPRAGGQLRDRRQDAAPRQHAAAQRLAVPLRLHRPAARLLRPGLLAGRERRRGARPGPRARPALGAQRSTGTPRVGLSLLDTEITDATDIIEVGACGDCDGNSLPFAPEVSGSAILTYRTPIGSGEGFFTTEYVYRSEMFGGPDNLPDATVDSWDEFNFRLGYRSDSTW